MGVDILAGQVRSGDQDYSCSMLLYHVIGHNTLGTTKSLASSQSALSFNSIHVGFFTHFERLDF